MALDRKLVLKKSAFFIILILCAFPPVFFSFRSVAFHLWESCPKVKDGVLQVDGYNLARPHGIPLDGVWQFYPNQLIQSNPSQEVEFCSVVVPQREGEAVDIGSAKNSVIGSYRLLIEDCPTDKELVVYLPNSAMEYEIYLNGKMISQRGRTPQADSMETEQQGIFLPEGRGEVVVELIGSPAKGLFLAPVLAYYPYSHRRTDSRHMILAGVLTASPIMLLGLLGFSFGKGKGRFALPLLILDTMIFVRIFLLNSNLFWNSSLFDMYGSALNTFLQIAILFLPVVFLYCANKLLHIPFPKKSIRRIALYELMISPVLLWCAMEGMMKYVLILTLISYLPFLYVGYKLYLQLENEEPYILTVTGVLMLTLSAMAVSTMARTGLFILDFTLYAPVVLFLTMLLQLRIFSRRSQEIQQQALEAETLRVKLRESEMTVLLCQIKPHFLYNTLLAIQMLCVEEPETAAETVMKFSRFLRANMNFINCKEPIPFSQELAHIKNYLEIEQLRFQRRLEVEYQIEVENFAVPALSIQPFVENAVVHGACKNVHGGVVRIHTRQVENGYIIEIDDNGPGFDRDVVKEKTNSHGMENATMRIGALSQGTVECHSRKNVGTLIRVWIPKEED